MGKPVALLKFKMAPRLILLMSSGSKKGLRYTCLSEAKASRSQRMWAEVSSSAPHLLNSGLSDSPSRWRCLLGVLCPVRRPVTALDCVLFKDIHSRKYIFAEYNQQDETFLNLLTSVRCSTCFRRVFRPSSGAQNCTYSVRYLSAQYCYLLLARPG